MNNIPDIFRRAILDRYPNAQNLRVPDVCGTKNNVIFADVGSKTYVFKFGDPVIIRKNAYISQIYRESKIPVPHIKACQYKNVYFEEYEMLAGKTLFEAVRDGMSGDKIKQIYREILDNMAKMRNVSPHLLDNHPYKNVHVVAREHVAGVNNATLGKICMALVYMLNCGAKKDNAIFHSDITPKNTVVSDDGHLVGFLDIDSVAVGNINYMFGAMAIKYQQLGLDITELFDYYEKISDTKLNRARIRAMANANNFGKKMLWMHAQRKR